MNLSIRRLTLIIVAGTFLSGVAGFAISRLLAQTVSRDIQTLVKQLIFDAIEAGPLRFARLHSSAIANQQLSQLMITGNLASRGVLSVAIAGGSSGSFEHARWDSNKIVPAECKKETIQNFEYSDAIFPFQIKVVENTCAHLSEQGKIFDYTGVAVSLGILITILLVLTALLPIIFSVKRAENLIRKNTSEEIDKIIFLPVRDLASKALSAVHYQNEIVQLKIYRQVAHDIRSPLSALTMGISHLRAKEDSDIFELIDNAATRIKEIAEDLLKQSKKLDQDTALSFSEKTSLSDDSLLSVSDVSALLVNLTNEKKLEYANKLDIKFFLDLPAKPLAVRASSTDLMRILSNIVNNAVESLPSEKGEICIGARDYGQRVLVFIRDNGSGMSEDIIGKIGNSVFSHGKTHTANTGSGLGLYSAKKMLACWKAEMRISSKSNEGTLIEILFTKINS
ncbi:MAG: sensor histidine kinase [Pseudobdellovibrionaceae bacterium]